MPDNMIETQDGILLVSNGIDAVLRWDGLTDQAEVAGIAAPTTATSLSSSGVGSIVGTYSAYVRFVDVNGQFSSLSPVSSEHDAVGATGTITAASAATPIVITSTAHGLTTGTIVKIADVLGNTSANGVWTITVVSANTFSLNGSSGGSTYTTGGTWSSGVLTITFSSVPTTTNPRVVRRQILRNTDGQTQTYYVDVDTFDMNSATFSSTKNDDTLSTQTSFAVLDSNGVSHSGDYNPPPDWKAVLAFHLDRVFAAVDVEYVEGSVSVTDGDTVVTGIGTEWPSTFAGRSLYVVGARQVMSISSVNVSAQTLTLTEPYRGTTDAYSAYAIRPPVSERRLIYFSLAGEPEAWPATNAMTLQEDGDQITGLMVKGSFLYILERRHIYRFTFQDNPADDGFIFLASDRGCVNQRCWVQVDDVAYMLDEQGCHAFASGQETDQISIPIQPLFDPGSASPYKINWRASRFFHAVNYRAQETVRWFVAMSGSYLPRHALCYHYRYKRWWIEEFAVPVGSSCPGDANNTWRIFLGSAARRIFAYGVDYLDGPDASAGTVRGTVTSASLTTLADTSATFASSGLVGSPIVIVSGAGKGQRRMIASVSGTTIRITHPWLEKPDTTSTYQIGGVIWDWKSGWFRFVRDDERNARRVELTFEPLVNAASLDMRLYVDSSGSPIVWAADSTSTHGDGVAVIAGEPDLTVDLTKDIGFAQKRYDGHKQIYFDGKRYMSLQMTGVSNKDRVTIFSATLDGVEQ